CYNSMLQGRALEHNSDPSPALSSQPTSLPTSHRWILSTRSRGRPRESSSAQFGPKFKALPPITTNFTSLALTGNILQPRSPTDTPKRFKTDAPVESSSTLFTMPHNFDIRSPSVTPTITPVNFQDVEAAENSISDKKHKQDEDETAESSSVIL
ncbi:putative X-linked retinitis pigmentosa GTPase regulator, partial [Triplophysa rosa]